MWIRHGREPIRIDGPFDFAIVASVSLLNVGEGSFSSLENDVSYYVFKYLILLLSPLNSCTTSCGALLLSHHEAQIRSY